MASSPHRSVIAAIAASVVLAGCGGQTADESISDQSSLYCDLIEPKDLARLTAGEEVKAVGTPTPKSDFRRVDCNLYGADSGDTLLLTTQRELSSAEKADAERSTIESEKTKYSESNPDQYTELDSDGLSGYAWFDGTTAYAHLMTSSRAVLISAPATTDQADVSVEVLLDVAQEIETNLDRYDAENPAD